MNGVEDRVRAALRERARQSPVDPDAWRSISERARRSGRFARPGRPGGKTRLRISVAAAACLVLAGLAVVVSGPATTGRPSAAGGTQGSRTSTAGPSGAAGQAGIGGGAQSAPPTGAAGLEPGPAGPGVAKGTLPTTSLVALVPPGSAILGYHYLAGGQTVRAYFWLGRWNPAYWFDFISPGRQVCSVIFKTNGGPAPDFGRSGPVIPPGASAGQAACQPLPSAARLVQVSGGWDADHASGITGVSMRWGIAAGAVSSVTAVLPDGRALGGVVGTGRGFADRVWSVAYPPGQVRIVFRDASGHVLATLGNPPAPAGPTPFLPARPDRGGVLVFDNPHATRPLAVFAYLIDGRVAFFGSGRAALGVSPYPTGGGPALAGLLVSAGLVQTGPHQFAAPDEYIGYARADVTRIVLHIPGSAGVRKVYAATFPAWPGSGLRLWAVQWPQNQTLGPGATTVTGYDAAGQVVATVDVGAPAP